MGVDRRTWRRAAIIVGSILGLSYVAYVAAVASILHLDLLRSWTASTANFRVSSQGGYSLWPGVVHARGMELVIRDYNMTMQITAKKVMLDVSMLSALRGQARVENAVVRGGKVRMRHRVHDAKKNAERIAAFPTIPGFERSAEYPKGPRKWPSQFPIRFDHIDAEADDLWFLEVRSTGLFRATGGFALTEDVVLFPCDLQISRASTSVARRHFMTHHETRITAEMGPFPRRKAAIAQVLSTLDLTLKGQWNADDLGALELHLSKRPLFLAGSARVVPDLTLQKGRLLSGGVQVQRGTTSFRIRDLPLSFAFHGSASVAESGALALVAELAPALYSKSHAASAIGLSGASARLSVEQPFYQPALIDMNGRVTHLSTDRASWLRELTGASDAPMLTFQMDAIRAHLDQKQGSFDSEIQGAITWFLSKERTVGVSASAELRCAQAQQASAPASATTNVPEDPQKHWSCPQAVVHADPLWLRTGDQESEISLALEASDLEVTTLEHIDSTWLIRSENPKPVINELLGKNVGAQLGVAVLPLGATDITLHLNRDGNTWAGRLGEANVGGVSVRGEFVAAQSVLSAWVLTTPLGRFELRQGPDGVSVRPLLLSGKRTACEGRLAPGC